MPTFPTANFAFIFGRIAAIVPRLHSKQKWRRRLVRLSGAGLLVVLLGWFALPFAVSLPAGLLENPVASPVLLDRHGAPLLHLPLPDASRATPVKFEEIPADFIACTLAAEDKRF